VCTSHLYPTHIHTQTNNKTALARRLLRDVLAASTPNNPNHNTDDDTDDVGRTASASRERLTYLALLVEGAVGPEGWKEPVSECVCLCVGVCFFVCLVR
jgi:hypothetical protein